MALNCGCNNGYNRALNDKETRDAVLKHITDNTSETGLYKKELGLTDKLLIFPSSTAVAAIGGAGLLFAGLKLAKKIR